ncbi:MAG: hypothetical protein JO119_08225, partial [Acidobacteria bacterium]|nr:hypothetical protein [Acidobacteriota bacterium]
MTTGNQFGAGQSLLGYLYQCRVALLLALRKTKRDPGLQLSIERFDDVSFDDGDSPLELIQTKHHMNKVGSLSDRSVDLWKTIGIWSEGIANDQIEPAVNVLTLLTTARAAPGSVASYLRSRDRNEATALKILEGIAVQKIDPANQNSAAFARFRNLSEGKRRLLVNSIYIVDSAPQITEVRREIEDEVHYAAPPQHHIGFVDRLEGWWFRKVIVHLSGLSSHPIFGQEIEAQVEYIREQYQAENLTIDFFDAEPIDGVDADGDKRLFVEQLRLVAISNPRIADAI